MGYMGSRPGGGGASGADAARRAPIPIGALGCLACLLLVVAACGSSTTVGSAGGTSTTPSKTDAMPTGLSEPYDLALVSTGADEFVLGDGGVGSGGKHTSTVIDRIWPGRSKEVARLDMPLRTPKAWVNSDGSITIVGMKCADDGDFGPSCPSSPLIAVRLGPDDKTTTWDLHATTAGSVGFAAGPLGADGLAIVTLDTATKTPHVYTAATPATRAVDRGTVDLTLPAASLICAANKRTFIFPAGGSQSEEPAKVYEVSPKGVRPAASLVSMTNDLPTVVSGCSNTGDVLVSTLVDQKISRSIVQLEDPKTSKPVVLGAPYDAGEVSLADDGRLLAWTKAKERDSMGAKDTWKLSAQANGRWERIGQISSIEAPQRTVAGPDAVAVIVLGGKGMTVEVLK